MQRLARSPASCRGRASRWWPPFATPIALSLRSRILGSIYPDGGQPRVDPARVIGAALGAVARVVQRASVDVVAAVRDAVATAAIPELPPATSGVDR